MDMQELIKDFRVMFPEFSAGVYTDAMVEQYLTMAKSFVNACTFGELYTRALFLVTAHYLAMASANRADADGTVSGDGGQLGTSKTVGPVSISYSTPAGFDSTDAFSATSYGRDYLSLVRLFGVGCVQL